MFASDSCYVSIELGRFGPALLYRDRNPRLRLHPAHSHHHRDRRPTVTLCATTAFTCVNPAISPGACPAY
jgi:hypothetical protein